MKSDTSSHGAKPYIAVACLLPFTATLGLITYSKITFYPFTDSIGLYDHEVIILWLLFAPFVAALPTMSRALTIARRVYLYSSLLIFSFSVFGLLGASIIA